MGRSGALTGAAGRSHRGAVAAERVPLPPAPAPSPEGRTGLLHQRATLGLQTPTKESSRKELIKEFQFPSTQPLVLCEHKTNPGHSHC